MLASSSAVMLASTTNNQQPSPSSSSRPSFPSLVRTLLLMVSPSSTSNTSTANKNDTNHSELDGELEDIKNNSLFLEAYFSFPALEEDCETTSVNHCAADRIHQQHPLLVGSNQVFC